MLHDQLNSFSLMSVKKQTHERRYQWFHFIKMSKNLLLKVRTFNCMSVITDSLQKKHLSVSSELLF